MTTRRVLGDKELLRLTIKVLRDEAQSVGPQHAYWDIIFDLEAWLKELEQSGR